MSLFTALTLMNKEGVSQLPVISENGARLVGLLDRESIDLACRYSSFILWIIKNEKLMMRNELLNSCLSVVFAGRLQSGMGSAGL